MAGYRAVLREVRVEFRPVLGLVKVFAGDRGRSGPRSGPEGGSERSRIRVPDGDPRVIRARHQGFSSELTSFPVSQFEAFGEPVYGDREQIL